MAAPTPEEVLAAIRQPGGLPRYDAPEACMPGGPACEAWSLAAAIYCRLAGMPEGFPGHGPEAFGFHFPPLRVYSPHLPPGVEPILRRSLSHDPARRHPSPQALLAALEAALNAAREREAWDGGIDVDVSGATRIGLMHELSGIPNQDTHGILAGGLASFVCDGVTHALIGTGDLASLTAAAALSASLPPLAALPSLEERAGGLLAAFEEAGRAVMARSLKLPLGRLATDPGDLMATTAVAAVIHGRQILLATTGDSRAYLVRDGVAEQLTVDGDVRCVQLAMGMPPEEAAAGADAHALYHCLGVGRRTRAGHVHDEERARPALTLLHLLPGDVVVLCTDGLVEEGVFLSPEELAALVEANPGPHLADLLVESACALHRPPEGESEGSGDDVTCVVIRVVPAR